MGLRYFPMLLNVLFQNQHCTSAGMSEAKDT